MLIRLFEHQHHSLLFLVYPEYCLLLSMKFRFSVHFFVGRRRSTHYLLQHCELLNKIDNDLTGFKV